MDSPPRRLRVLLIDDEKGELAPEWDGPPSWALLGSDDLDVCQPEEGAGYSLRSWSQLLGVISSQAALQRPDILLIDCDFRGDRDAERPQIPDGRPDTRGFLYGAVVASLLRGSGRAPLGLAPYSKKLPDVKDSPEAQTYFGILLALAGNPMRRASDIAARLDRSEAGTDPTAAVGQAVKHFRESLMHAVAHRGLDADPASFLRAATYLEGARTEPEAPSLKWDCDSQNVLVSSVFADYRRYGKWDPSQDYNAAAAWLRQVAALADSDHGVTAAVRAWISDGGAEQLAKGAFTRRPPLAVDTAPARANRQRVLLFTVVAVLDWMAAPSRANPSGTSRRSDGKPSKAKDICRMASLTSGDDQNHEQALSRAFREVFPVDVEAKSPAAYRSRLLSGPSWPERFPTWIRTRTQACLTACGHADRSKWPQPLR